MIKSEKKFILDQASIIKKTVINRFDISEEFVDKIFETIISNYSQVIATNYRLKNIYDNPILVYKLILSICLNYEFDKDRLNSIELNNQYVENFSQRIVAQIIYSDLDNLSFQMSKTINHPVILSMLSISNIIKYRIPFDYKSLHKSLHKDFTPIFRIIKEAMESLEGVLLLIANKDFSQAMTVYRLYLEQVITSTALIKNYNLIDDYLKFQELTIKYARDTADSDVLKFIEEKKIPPRDIKSFLNYGWIENMDGFKDLPKARYSIKIMSKLCGMENIYELYSDSTNYVHMNLLFTDINWTKEINKVVETLLATIIGIMYNYKVFTGYNFVYKNINLQAEIETVFSEFESILNDKDYSYDVLKLKSA